MKHPKMSDRDVYCLWKAALALGRKGSKGQFKPHAAADAWLELRDDNPSDVPQPQLMAWIERIL